MKSFLLYHDYKIYCRNRRTTLDEKDLDSVCRRAAVRVITDCPTLKRLKVGTACRKAPTETARTGPFLCKHSFTAVRVDVMAVRRNIQAALWSENAVHREITGSAWYE
jgi:hypothetical protein